MGETSCFTAGVDLAPLSMIDNNVVGWGRGEHSLFRGEILWLPGKVI